MSSTTSSITEEPSIEIEKPKQKVKKGKSKKETDVATAAPIIETDDNKVAETATATATTKPIIKKKTKIEKPQKGVDLENVAVPKTKLLVSSEKITIEIMNATKVLQFKQIFQNIKLFCKDMNLYINTDSLYIQTLDSSHSSVFELKLPKSWFDTWNVPKNVVIGILPAIFYNMLKYSESSILMEYDIIKNTDKIKFEIKLDYSLVKLQMPLIDIENEILDIPFMDEYSVYIQMCSTFFFDIIDRLKNFGEENIDMIFSITNILLQTQNPENDAIFSELIETENVKLTDYQLDANIDSIKYSFAMKHIYNIAVFHKIAKTVKIYFSLDQPLKMVYDIGGCDDGEEASVVFYLAPKYDINEENLSSSGK
jgi:DNA polymerase III sliding clamp (beta) subunit (PCNA family)